ncbi:papilin isoform X2 [Diorhabda carinulata]|uniref:papilin isoform X2 n=2 Tax=Diorhabda carinulata TaxID=1163345 RepID=UPI0025A1BC90|nr:papilin isoform X2 [Diorhabda carinulata]
MELFRKRYNISPLIVAVIFITFFHNVLSRHKIRHYKERFKRQQGANLYLPGSFVTDNEDAESGPWQEWSAPSPCSRTCGGGVSTQSRKCIEGYDCVGPSARYFSCNTQDCPDNADYRAQQCAEHNKILFEGVYYEWLPYTKGPVPCELNCMPKGEKFYYRHADAVVDGTRCTDEGYDVCVRGKCQPVGCDRMLGSQVKEDRCRVCGGDDSSCNTFTNIITMKDMQRGYNDILLIPAGATNIKIEELASSNNYLAVRNTSGYYYLNGNWMIDFPKSIDFAGTKFKYDRISQEIDAPDKISALGPTDESLFIVLLYQDGDVPVSYTYSLPTMVPPPPNETYAWIYDEYTPCSVSCGKGNQSRNVSCAERNSLKPASESLCEGNSKPESSRMCNEIDCEANWVLEEWTNCSVPCGKQGGVQKRKIVCKKITANGTEIVVDNKECSKESQPEEERPCNVDTLCPKWYLEPWKPCDHLCGDGKQTRGITCYMEDKERRKKILPNAECEKVLPKPETEKPCFIRPCEGVDWITSEWSGCTACGLTQETRKVLCATENEKVQPDELCNPDRKPEAIRECASNPCLYLWYAGQWSECSVTCGRGVQTRVIFCGISTPNGVEKADESKCDPSKHFDTTRNCTGEKEECDGEWFSGPMGECSRPCGGGQRTRKVVCIKDYQVVHPSACGSDKIVFSEEKCNEEPCSEDTLMPKDITHPVDESEPTKEYSGKREVTTTPLTTEWRSDETTIFEITTSSSITSTDSDEYEIVPDTNCDDGEWVEENTENEKEKSQSVDDKMQADEEIMQGDDPFASEDLMMGDQPFEGSGETTYGTDSTDTSYSTETTSFTESTGTTEEFTEEQQSTTDFSESTIEFTGSTDSSVSTETGETESTTYFADSTESSGTTIENTGSTESVETTTKITGSTQHLGTTIESTTSIAIEEFNGSVIESDVNAAISKESTDETTVSTELPVTSTEFTESPETTITESSETTITLLSSTESSDTTTENTEFTGSSESTTEFTASTHTSESETDLTKSTEGFLESTETTIEFTGSTEITTEITGSTDLSQSTTLLTESTESSVSVTTVSSEESPQTTEEATVTSTEFTVSTETSASTTEFTQSTEESKSTSESITEYPESTTGSTESTGTTEFTSSSESSVSTMETTGSTESEVTGLTESSASTVEFTGSTESTIVTEITGSTESTISTESTEVTAVSGLTSSTESSAGTTEFTGSTEFTTEITGSTESSASTTEFTGSTEFTTEITGSTESSASTTEFTESTEITGSTESSASTTEFTGSTEFTTEITGSTESSASTTEFTGSTEFTTEITGSTESSASTTEFTGSTEFTTEITGSTESSVSTVEFTGSTESSESTSEYTPSTEYSSSTESSFGTTELTMSTETVFTESTTEFSSSTESTTSIMDIFTLKPRLCKRRKIKQCRHTQYGCCWDNITPAQGPFDKGCPIPRTCKESKFGCCEDGVSPALGSKFAGCPRYPCNETLFGCCPDNKTVSQGNDNEGCPPVCLSSKYGCCSDNVTEATGPHHKGCPEDTTTLEPTTESVTETTISTVSTEETTTTSGSTESSIPTEMTYLSTEVLTETTTAVNCNLTPYRCCPDGITTAEGPGFQGCGLPCSDTTFGCCQDAKTPAHGPSGEGCCLSSRFGCCPNDITPSRGPNQEGCECVHSPYGCCPDNKTSARGYDNEGCGCQFTPHGCCPDSLTTATGANYAGCPCYTFQFGCCPDGITISEGPRYQGCGCRNTEFGCCSDEKTPASGPNGEGCTCENSKFGCCIDGVTEAKGENYDGCTDTPKNLQEGCGMPKERGKCRNFTVKWYFDMDYGGCSRFWYGGCDGNENRYKSKEECEDICVQPRGADRCKLPKVSGPCEGYFLNWYYDKNFKTCTQFVYGGCLGNNNRFETKEECMNTCAVDTNPDPCRQKKEPGPCKGTYQRYYFDNDLEECQEFIYGGCKGNRNNFVTLESCKQQCAPAGKRKDLCSLPKSEGNCTDILATWYYDTSRKNCAPFYYSGCYGNLNNFETREACQSNCPPEIEMDTCHLPANPGECSNYVGRWYYDTRTKSCRQFYYGGCGGNGNNFETQQICEQICEKKEGKPALTSTTPQPQPSPPPSFTVDMCFLPSDSGPCLASFRKYYYDSRDGVCKEFIYGGCLGNGNNFDSIEQCLGYCRNAQDQCSLPPVRGPCDNDYLAYYYDKTTDSCQQFVYGGCSGNTNMFRDQESCETTCKKIPEPPPTYTQAPTTATDALMCFQQPDHGNCTDRFTAFYYDSVQQKCLPFMYTGCGGNSNRFNSEEQCQRQCGTFKDQDVCNLPRDPGPCRGYFVKYYYERSTGRCEQFAYGGCQGNGNRFSSEEECSHICITHEEKKPNVPASVLCRLPVDQGSCNMYQHKRWYFNDTKGECIAFIYSGCGGNFNNFKSYQYCLDYCKELLIVPETQPVTTQMPEHPCQAAFDECTTLRCAYGVEPFVDENECNRCRCRDPCMEIECLPDEQCAIDININKTSPQDADFIAICRKQIKPGTCPQLDISDNNCEVECRSDADCALQMKCCSTGCGTACVDPPAQLVTQEPPVITVGQIDEYQPPHVDPIVYKPEVSALIGDQATLRCAVSGNPNPRIRWSKDNIEIDGTQPRYRIKLDQSLQIITLHKTDSGIYLCTASNGVGQSITNQVKLEVIESEPRPVTMLSEQGDQPVVVSLNDPTTLNCMVLGYPFPTVTWWKDDSMIPFKNSEYEISKDYSLLIHSVRLQNLGIYTCQAYNGYGKAASWSVTVKARGPVHFSNPDDFKYNKWIINEEGIAFTTTTTTTTTTAAPILATTSFWDMPDTPLPPILPPYTEPSNYIVTDPIPEPGGREPPPSTIVPVRANITSNDQRYPVGSDIELPCEYGGSPTPQVQWYKDGVAIHETGKLHISETDGMSMLTIEQAIKADSGSYQCEATNAYSRASSMLEISIEGMYIHPSCIDNQFFANCALIVRANYCSHKYYAKFCCRSCTEAGLLPIDGPHIHKKKRHNVIENNLE